MFLCTLPLMLINIFFFNFHFSQGLAIYEDGSREEKEIVEVNVDLEGVTNGQEQMSHETNTRFGVEGDGYWEESFGGHKDSKPHGPTSVGVDISFPQSSYLYGLPEHASSLRLQTTKGENSHYSEPYRM